MDTVISRILKIEKESANDIESAAAASRRKMEAYRSSLEEKKAKTFAEIRSAQNARLMEFLKALHQKTEKESLARQREYESRFQDPVRIQIVKEKITELLLSE